MFATSSVLATLSVVNMYRVLFWKLKLPKKALKADEASYLSTKAPRPHKCKQRWILTRTLSEQISCKIVSSWTFIRYNFKMILTQLYRTIPTICNKCTDTKWFVLYFLIQQSSSFPRRCFFSNWQWMVWTRLIIL